MTSPKTYLGVEDDALERNGVYAAGAEDRQRVLAGEDDVRVGRRLAYLPKGACLCQGHRTAELHDFEWQGVYPEMSMTVKA